MGKSRSLNWARLNFLLIILALLLPVTPALGQTLKIGHDTWVGYSAAFVAKDRGLFAKQGLKVETKAFTGPGDTLPPLLAGHLDVAFTTLHNLVLMQGKGDLVAIYLLDTSNGADAVVASKNIKTIADLKGKKIAVTLNEVNHMLLMSALERGGLKSEDVQMVNLSAEDGGAALLAGKVDAAVTWEPWVTRAKSNGGNIVFTSADTPNLILDAVVVRKDTLVKKGEALKKLIRGIDAGHKFMMANPQQARPIIAKFLSVKPAEVDSMLAGDIIYDLAGNRELFGGMDNPGPAYQSMGNVLKFLSQRGLVKGEVDPKELISPLLIQE